jgi:hypothetical protein
MSIKLISVRDPSWNKFHTINEFLKSKFQKKESSLGSGVNVG